MSSPSQDPGLTTPLYQPVESIADLESGDQLCDVAAGEHRVIKSVDTDSVIFCDGEQIPHMIVKVKMVHLPPIEEIWEGSKGATEGHGPAVETESSPQAPTTVSPKTPGGREHQFSDSG